MLLPLLLRQMLGGALQLSRRLLKRLLRRRRLMQRLRRVMMRSLLMMPRFRRFCWNDRSSIGKQRACGRYSTLALLLLLLLLLPWHLMLLLWLRSV